MNLLFAITDIPWWVWIIVAVVLVILIIIIVVATKKSGKKDKAAEVEDSSDSESEEEEEEPVEEEEKAPAKKAEDDKKAEKDEDKEDDKKPNKPATKVYHISKRKDDGKWQIKAEGGAKAIKLFKTQKEAIDYCKTLADNQDARIMIHKEDGSFRKLTY